MIEQTGGDRLLHLLTLGSRRWRRYWFERECERNQFSHDPCRSNLFICGMARAGSTVLTSAIHAGGGFGATTYAMMPLLLAPGQAGMLARIPRATPQSSERAHRDGIQVSLDSVEALDGIFWSTLLAVQDPVRQPRAVPPEILRAYAMFIDNLLAVQGESRYLAKMNQGLDKLAALVDYFTESRFLVPFRQPRFQALSLLRQHRLFTDLSWYQRQYFGWLEHDEFGALHRRFVAQPQDEAPRWSADEPNYWLSQWRDSYRYLAQLARQQERILPVCYEKLATQAQRLARHCDCRLDESSFVNRNSPQDESQQNLDPVLLAECESLYAHLDQLAEARQ